MVAPAARLLRALRRRRRPHVHKPPPPRLPPVLLATVALAAFVAGAAWRARTTAPLPAVAIAHAPPHRVRVVDGDTLVVNGVTVRLKGVDAPESEQECWRGGGGWGVARRRYKCGEREEKREGERTRERPRGRTAGVGGGDNQGRHQTPCPPPSPFPSGDVATAALRAWLRGRSLACTGASRDKYGRTLARCAASSRVPWRPRRDVGHWLLARGHAVAYGGATVEDRRLEAMARGRRVGVWGGRFERPAVWRAKREAAALARRLERARQDERKRRQ